MTTILLVALLYGQRPMQPRNYGYQPPRQYRNYQPPGMLPMRPNQPMYPGNARCQQVFLQGRWQTLCW